MTVSIALAIYGLAGGQLNPVSFVGGGVVLQTPGTILWIAHIGWLYLLWRYWLYSRDAHANVRRVVLSYLHSSRCYQRLVQHEIDRFQDESGVAYAQAWQEAALEDDDQTEFRPIPVNESVEGSWFRRKLVLKVDDHRGDYNPDHKEVTLPFLKYELCVAVARLRAALGHYLVSDIYIPYMIAVLPALAAVWQWLYV